MGSQQAEGAQGSAPPPVWSVLSCFPSLRMGRLGKERGLSRAHEKAEAPRCQRASRITRLHGRARLDARATLAWPRRAGLQVATEQFYRFLN